MRVVLDTNMVVSALLFPHGKLSPIRWLWTAAHILPLASRATTQELIRVLAYPKFRLTEQDIQAVLAAYLPFAEAVRLSRDPDPTLPACRDPDDQIFLELALRGRADVLVTGDHAMLEMVRQVPFAIETPTQFQKRFK